jgi:hypothetical protein
MHSRYRSDSRVDIPLGAEHNRDAALLRATTELFIQEVAHDRDEVRRYEELAAHFLPRVAIEDRIFVAERLAPRADAPLAIIRMLAKDKIEVARPVISRSVVLGSLDLLTIMAATGVDHHKLIARRPGLSSDVEQALRIAGNVDVIASLDEAKAVPVEATTRGEPAKPSHAANGLPAKSPDWFTQRQAVGVKSGRLDPWLFLQMERPARLRLMADLAVRAPTRRSATSPNPVDRAFRSILGAAQIVGFARSGQRDALVSSIAESLEIESAFVAASLDDVTGEPLAVLLKALRLDNVQVQQVFLLASPKVGRDVTAFFRLADLYAGMEPVVAETLIEAWRDGADSAHPRHEPLFAENGRIRRPGVADQPREERLPQADIDRVKRA